MNIKADPDNAGKVFVGVDSSVTTSTGFELAAGDETGWLPAEDGELHLIASSASELISYIFLT